MTAEHHGCRVVEVQGSQALSSHRGSERSCSMCSVAAGRSMLGSSGRSGCACSGELATEEIILAWNLKKNSL